MTITTPQWIHNARLRRAWTWVILPVLVYTLAAGIMTWPLPRHLGTHAAGVGYGDTYMMLRQAWEAKEQLLDGANPLQQERIAYPDGITSRVMWSTPLRWVPVMLLAFVFPPVLAFNLWLIATLVLNGLTAYWLGMALARGSIPAALLGGLVFTAFPSMQGHLSVGHIDVLAMYGLPLFALCWWRVLFGGQELVGARPGWRTVFWGGVWFAVASLGLTSQVIYNLMPLVVFSGLYALLAQRRRVIPAGQPWHTWPLTRAAAMVALGGAILLVFFGPLLTGAGRAEIERLKETGRVTFSADPLAFVSPSPFGPLDDLVPGYALDVLGTNTAEGAAYLGLAASLLVLAGLLARREARPWLAVALGAMLLSLGPLLKWRDAPLIMRFEDYKSYVTLPWAVLQDLPVLRDTRTAGRFNGATALAWGALVSIGAGALLPRLRRDVVRAGVVIALAAVILLEYQLFWPYATGSADQPDYFKRLRAMDDVDAVYNVPAQSPTAQMQAMAQQMIHEKPLVGGQLYRLSPQDPALLAVLDRALLTGARREAGSDALPDIPPHVIPALLRQTGADRVILHKRFVPDAAGAVERLREVLGDPEFEDAWHAAFVVPAQPGYPGEMPVIAGGRVGWSPVVSLDGVPVAFMGDGADWHFYAPESFYGELVIPAQGYALSRKLAVRLDGDLIAGVWAEPSGNAARVPLWVAAGFHTLHFEAVAGCTSYPFTLTCLAGGECRGVEPPACISAGLGAPAWEPADSTVTPLDVELGQGVRLRGYDVRVLDGPGDDARAVWVRLFWAADRALPESYALFVHIADTTSAAPFAQYSDFPLIQTPDWDGGARWVSEAVIPLDAGIPAGDYAINVGWFEPESGTRLPVRGVRPWADAGIVHLETVTVGE